MSVLEGMVSNRTRSPRAAYIGDVSLDILYDTLQRYCVKWCRWKVSWDNKGEALC